MEDYCARCHSTELIHDFDSLFGIKAVSDHMDETEQLGEWIACGMP